MEIVFNVHSEPSSRRRLQMTEMETTRAQLSSASSSYHRAWRNRWAHFVFPLNATGGEHNTCLCAAAVLPASYLSLAFLPHREPAWNVAISEEG